MGDLLGHASVGTTEQKARLQTDALKKARCIRLPRQRRRRRPRYILLSRGRKTCGGWPGSTEVTPTGSAWPYSCALPWLGFVPDDRSCLGWRARRSPAATDSS